MSHTNVRSFCNFGRFGNHWIVIGAMAILPCVQPLFAQVPGDIYTFAGTTPGGYTGDGGPANQASLDYPRAITMDSQGNTFFSDTGNSVVREINSSGIISTFAGGPNIRSNNYGGPATSSYVGSIASLAADSNGNVYLAGNQSGDVLQVVNSAGIITAVSSADEYCSSPTGDGGPASSACIGVVVGMVADQQHNVYLATELGNVRIIHADGTISTFYSGIPGLSGGIALDAAGDVYVSVGQTGYAIYKLSPTGTSTLVAGTGSYGEGADGQPATQAAIGGAYYLAINNNGDLLFSEQNFNLVKIVSASTGLINTFAGTGVGELNNGETYNGDGIPATQANIYGPDGLYSKPNGDVLIVDSQNERLQYVAAQ